jgi:hypothetical protein
MKTLKQYINEASELTKRYSLDKIYDLMNDLDNGEFSENEVQSVIDYFINTKNYKVVKNDNKNFSTKLQSSKNDKVFIYFQIKKDKWGNDPFWEWSNK